MTYPLEWHWRCTRQKTSSLLTNIGHQLPQKRKKHTTPFILTLPNELLLTITDHLPVDAQACLALTNKNLLTVLAPVLKHPELRYPSIWAVHETATKGYASTRTNARNHLLLRLQDRHWAYCSMCQKLHPSREFTKSALAHSPKKRVCMDPGLGGVVQLCPCMLLTVRAKAALMKSLLLCKRFAHFPPATATATATAAVGVGVGGDDDDDDDDDGQPALALGRWRVRRDDETGRGMLVHSCEVVRRNDRVEIILRPFLEHGDLYVTTEYIFRLHHVREDNEGPQTQPQPQPQSQQSTSTTTTQPQFQPQFQQQPQPPYHYQAPLLNCPHSDNIPDPGYTYTVTPAPAHANQIPNQNQNQRQEIGHCLRCETVFVRCIPAPSGLWRKLFTYRNLGGFEMASVTWRQQCEGALGRWNRRLWEGEGEGGLAVALDYMFA